MSYEMNIAAIREGARRNIDEGAITEHYGADKADILRLLNGALATEWVCALRYTQHQIIAEGIHAEPVAKHFGAHAVQEQQHAMELATRIRQLGGHPSLNPSNFVNLSHAEYKECDSLRDMIKENLIAERIAIESYSAMIRILGSDDPTTRRMLEGILATEECHADEMASLLAFEPRERGNDPAN
ncbi:bacterioferritin [Planctomyces bekefii]|uniref:Bacterioferritin n=1 Tax=Planctomyces bekefii TaxID=1653850 RepID=A0A5C6MDN1_9PLAN|nr:bacterioferritin [Planctomyces bekefii]